MSDETWTHCLGPFRALDSSVSGENRHAWCGKELIVVQHVQFSVNGGDPICDLEVQPRIEAMIEDGLLGRQQVLSFDI